LATLGGATNRNRNDPICAKVILYLIVWQYRGLYHSKLRQWKRGFCISTKSQHFKTLFFITEEVKCI
jgi:hypothetical protein